MVGGDSLDKLSVFLEQLMTDFYFLLFLNFSAHGPQNNSARGWGPPSTLAVAYKVVHSRSNALLGLHRNQYNTKEQQPHSHNIIFKYFKKEYSQNLYNNGLNMQLGYNVLKICFLEGISHTPSLCLAPRHHCGRVNCRQTI